jgi:drug/metabolite transporter (DMT)-like permease
MPEADVATLGTRPTWVPWALLCLGVLAASLSAVFIKYADTAEPFAISFWRCALGAAALAPFMRQRPKDMDRTAVRLSVLAGFFLAVHFATWITSLELTTVAASVLLVTTGPIWVATASVLIFKERFGGIVWFGIAATLVGAALISGGDLSGSSLDGNILALIGGAVVGFYVLVGQVARRQLGIIEYSVITYTVAAVLLLITCVVADAPLWGYDGQTWAAIAAIVIGPQLLGHTVINLVLTDIDATTVTVTIMAEPIIATIFAYFLFDEIPHALVYPGGLAVLVGIYLVTTNRKDPESLEVLT